jgi:hypothetical protein
MIESLPYELIGQSVVLIVAFATFGAGVVVVSIGALVAWNRAWVRLSNRMYEGYDTHPKDARPPLWRMRIAAFCTGMANFQFRKIPAAIRESKELTDDHTTLREHIRGD